MPFNHFDVVAGLYNRVARFTVPERLLELLALQADSVLLDAGGGTGRISDALRTMMRRPIIVDSSRGMLHYAVDKGLTSTCSLVERLPFSEGAFDRILMVDALHHVLDQRQTVSELWRVLSPGGRIVIIEPDIQKFSVKLLAVGEKMLLMRSHFLSANKIMDLFNGQQEYIRVTHADFYIWVYAEKPGNYENG